MSTDVKLRKAQQMENLMIPGDLFLFFGCCRSDKEFRVKIVRAHLTPFMYSVIVHGKKAPQIMFKKKSRKFFRKVLKSKQAFGRKKEQHFLFKKGGNRSLRHC